MTNAKRLADRIVRNRTRGYDEEELNRNMICGVRDLMKYDGRLNDTGIGCAFAVEEGELQELIFYDDVTGEMLDFDEVMKAWADEIREFRKHGVYRKVPIQECYDRTGKSTHWR